MVPLFYDLNLKNYFHSTQSVTITKSDLILATVWSHFFFFTLIAIGSALSFFHTMNTQHFLHTFHIKSLEVAFKEGKHLKEDKS